MVEDQKSENGGLDLPKTRRRLLTRRNVLLALAGLAAIMLIAGIAAVILYRTGTLDSYIRSQFVDKMNYMGVEFNADVFSVRLSPLRVELRNAIFSDKKTGEKLASIRNANLGLSIENLFAWQLSRDITVDSTEVSGAEVWVKFDENGRSNFANLIEDTRPSSLNFKYSSMKFSLTDSVVHFADRSRSIGGEGNNIVFSLEPETAAAPEDQKRFKLALSATGSSFSYGDGKLENISITGHAIADRAGADITDLKIESPIGTSDLSGRLSDWANFKYDLNISSNIDLTQASNTLPLGATLRGVGNFAGRLTGEGEKYNIDGKVDSQSLSAEGVYLRAVNVAGTVAGTNSSYEANGRAVAELLTFEDFRIDFPKIAGNVRGTGTDFQWVGKLEAIAAKSKGLSMVGLFLNDAVAEYKDREFELKGNGRATKFSVADTDFTSLTARNLSVARRDGVTTVQAPQADSASMITPDYRLDGVRGHDVKVRNSKAGTTVAINRLSAKSAALKTNRASDVKAGRFELNDSRAGTKIELSDLSASRIDAGGTRIDGASAPTVTINDDQAATKVYADRLRVAGITGGGATLGSLNIAGVRLTIREGTVTGTSEDIDAGDVALNKNGALPDGGTLNGVKIMKPVFVVEPSGRYRASADMSIGGGMIGSVPLGNAVAKVDVNDSRIQLNEIAATVMNGSVTGTATVAFSSANTSRIDATFAGLDVSKIAAIQGGRVLPIEGSARGEVALTFPGTDVNSLGGTIRADLDASAGSDADGRIPVTGRVELQGDKGLFQITSARLSTPNSTADATGRFDLHGVDSALRVGVASTDASEVERLVRVLAISPELERQLDSIQASFAGDLKFTAELTGNLRDPSIEGSGNVASLLLKGREIGSVSTELSVGPAGTFLRNGLIKEPTPGGTLTFEAGIPAGSENDTTITAKLDRVNAGNLIAAVPVSLPEQLMDFTGAISGKVDLHGLPNRASGVVDISSAAGSISGHPFDSLSARAAFTGTRIVLEKGEVRVNDGSLAASGFYERATSEFNLDVSGAKLPLPLALSFLPKNSSIPEFSGTTEITAKAIGFYDRPDSYAINFSGSAVDVVVNQNAFGAVTFTGQTSDRVLTGNLTATLAGRQQVIDGSVNFADPNLPVRVHTSFDQSPLAPFFALIPRLGGITIGGTGTGSVTFGGNISQMDANGVRAFSADALSGSARFSQLDLLIQETPLSSQGPVVINFNRREIDFESAKFAGGGSNVTITGKKALTPDGVNNIDIEGRLNLALLNVVPQISGSDTFFGGFATVSVRLAGPNSTARLTGTASLENAAVAAFIGESRLSFDRVQGRILFASNQAQIESASGYLGGGKFDATGGVLFLNDLQVDSFRVSIDGTNITVPLPEDFVTTGDARLEFTGRRQNANLLVQIAGNIRAKRSLYSRDIELSNVLGNRREGSISSGPSSLLAPRFDLTIEGRDALVVKNNIADLTASVSLRLTGTTDSPQLSGRISANSGTVFFRKDRYVLQRGVLEFPPDTAIEPIVSIQAETEIQGYQVFVNLSGPLTDTGSLNAAVRSSPALPSQDVMSLITTGSLSNTEGGLPTFAQTGINTAAEVLTDSIVNEPVRKATDKLFGLNVFEIDPIITGQRLNPSARLTVGRQINNNLKATYSTNLSQDQNQVLALEYRVSNKLSVVAQYEQRSLSNVTRNRDNFSVEVRFRRRF